MVGEIELTPEEKRRRLAELRRELRELCRMAKPWGSGWLEFKWVYNKVRNKYYYWYYRFYDKDGTKHSIYLGKTIDTDTLRALGFKEAMIPRILSLYREIVRLLEEVG